MAFILTPRLVPAFQGPQCNPFGFCAPSSRPTYTYRVARPRPQRPQYSPFNHFFAQVDELLSDIDSEAERRAQIEAHLEAQREAHRQEEKRKQALHAQFTVNQTEQGWQVDGDIRGFDQENISIEVTDEHTLKIAGNTTWQTKKAAQSDAEDSTEGKMDGVTLNEPEYEDVAAADNATVSSATVESDTESHKSYQPTVEDDFEDLGAETSSLISSPSRPSSPAEVKEPKGKGKSVEEPASSTPEAPQQQDERVHGAFERSFRFPNRIDSAAVSASFQDGALKIVVPRAPVQQVQRIDIL